MNVTITSSHDVNSSSETLECSPPSFGYRLASAHPVMIGGQRLVHRAEAGTKKAKAPSVAIGYRNICVPSPAAISAVDSVHQLFPFRLQVTDTPGLTWGQHCHGVAPARGRHIHLLNHQFSFSNVDLFLLNAVLKLS